MPMISGNLYCTRTLFRSDYERDTAYFAAVSRILRQKIGKYRHCDRGYSGGKDIFTGSWRTVSGVSAGICAAVDAVSGMLTLEYQFQVSDPGDLLPLLKRIWECRDAHLRFIRLADPEDGLFRIIAGYSWSVSGTFSEAELERTLLRMDMAFFTFCKGKIPVREMPEQFPKCYARVLGIRPDPALFQREKDLILTMLRKANWEPPAEISPFADDSEELDNVWKELEGLHGKQRNGTETC